MAETTGPWPIRVARRIWWSGKALITGRLYYEDGTSERVDRSWAWKAMRPYPSLWLQRHLRFLVVEDPCGCETWRWGRPTLYCMGHGLGIIDTDEGAMR